MIVNLYTFPECGVRLPEDDWHVLDFDNADDIYNPYCNENRKDSFCIEDPAVLDSIKMLVMKHSIMYGDDFSFNNQFNKRQLFKDNDKFLFDTMEAISTEIYNNAVKPYSKVSEHINDIIASNIVEKQLPFELKLSVLSCCLDDDYQKKKYANVYSEFIQKYNGYNFIFRFQHYQYRKPSSFNNVMSMLRVNLCIKHS